MVCGYKFSDMFFEDLNKCQGGCAGRPTNLYFFFQKRMFGVGIPVAPRRILAFAVLGGILSCKFVSAGALHGSRHYILGSPAVTC